MFDSNKILNNKDNAYLYEINDKKLSLFATPRGRIPVGRKGNTRIIALSNNGRNYYPTDERLDPIPIQVGNKNLLRFKYK